MALIIKDRIKEVTTTTGTGTITLAGASTGFRSFADIGNANTTYYCISGGSQFEVGLGTYTASGTTLSRDTVLSNSLGTTALIDFSAGTKDVFCTYPSGKAILGSTSSVASTGTGSVVLSDSPTFTTAITSTGSLQLTGSATVAQNIATAQTTGTLTIGGTSATGRIKLGQSANGQVIEINTTNGNGATYLNGLIVAGGGLLLSGDFTTDQEFATSQSTGLLTIGGAEGTGTITLGQSTSAQTINVATGAQASSVTKRVNIGTGGATGSNTIITIGRSSTGTTSATTIQSRTLTLTAGAGNINISAYLRQTTTTVGSLIAQPAGTMAFVTDALSPVFGSIVVAGGSTAVPVYYDGTNWRVG